MNADESGAQIVCDTASCAEQRGGDLRVPQRVADGYPLASAINSSSFRLTSSNVLIKSSRALSSFA
jgi:hypothetical protein